MRRFAAFLPLLALLLVGCPGDTGEPSGDPGPEVAPVTVKVEPLLKYRFVADDSVKMHTTVGLVAQLGAMGEMTQKQADETTWVVKTVAEDGTGSLTQTYGSIKLDMAGLMFPAPVKYDSTAEDAAERAKDPVAAAGAVLLGKSIDIDITSNGEMTRVSGYDAIMAGQSEANTGMQGAGLLLGDDTQKSRMQISFPRFPKEEMVKGEQWSVPGEMAVPMVGSIKFDITYTLDGIVSEGGTTAAMLSFTAEITADGFSAPEADPNNPMATMLSQMQLSGGKLTGETRFDMMRGRLDRTEYELTLNILMMGMDMVGTFQVTQERLE